MPGSRLTEDDRRAVAEGLAAGSTYAEIARGLGRPTSTVSREVLRNGGPDAYRAERAHVATRERGRRVPAGPPAAAGFEEQFATMMVHTGLPRMPARVLAALLTRDEAGLPAADLVRHLGVSPASVSKAVAYLERLQLLTRAGGRPERYFVDDDVWYRACRREVEVCETWAATAHLGAGLLGGTPAGKRLAEMAGYFDHVGADLARAAEHWRHVFTRTGAQGS
ncbi:helix-turn-helix domain-containing protein [Amycolatopsis sp. NBC_00345]|uniref:GbsR/MarR family transcriptional regulator n=1 Tax=Amycolatopsis sp. NBC_00345 TaxID=2975955 RepID=UPI002E258897